MTAVWSWLADPWSQEILRRAFLEVALVGLIGGLVGPWVVVQGLSYGAESLAHGLLPGLVLAALLGVPLVLGGTVGIVVAALAVGLAGRAPGIGADTGVAIVVTALVGLGALLALSPESPAGLQGLLFGDVLGVGDLDLILAGGLLAAVVAVLVPLHPRLLAVGFGRSEARALGVRVGLVEAALLVLMAAAVLVAVQGLGSLLVVAALVAPAAAARLATRRMVPMAGVACALALLGGLGGLYLSYHAGLAAGASIAAVLVGAYAVVAAACGGFAASRRRRRSRPQAGVGRSGAARPT